MVINVFIVVISYGDFGNIGMKIGWYLLEVFYFYDVFIKVGFEVDFVSLKGGDVLMVKLRFIKYLKYIYDIYEEYSIIMCKCNLFVWYIVEF